MWRTKVDQQIMKYPLWVKLNEERLEIQRKLQASHKSKRKGNEAKAVMACKTNRKFFFSYAKKLSKVKQNIGPIIDQNGEAISNPGDMAEIINDQYETVWVKPLEPLEETAKMLPDEEGKEETTDQETIET